MEDRVLLNGNPDSKEDSYQWAGISDDNLVILTDYNHFTKKETPIVLSKEALEKMLKLFDEE